PSVRDHARLARANIDAEQLPLRPLRHRNVATAFDLTHRRFDTGVRLCPSLFRRPFDRLDGAPTPKRGRPRIAWPECSEDGDAVEPYDGCGRPRLLEPGVRVHVATDQWSERAGAYRPDVGPQIAFGGARDEEETCSIGRPDGIPPSRALSRGRRQVPWRPTVARHEPDVRIAKVRRSAGPFHHHRQPLPVWRRRDVGDGLQGEKIIDGHRTLRLSACHARDEEQRAYSGDSSPVTPCSLPRHRSHASPNSAIAIQTSICVRRVADHCWLRSLGYRRYCQ